MSRFFSKKLSALTPYTPGEQPTDMKYVKLNTNESPFPASEKTIEEAQREFKRLQLYPDPDCKYLNRKAAEIFGVEEDEILFGNGSDEILNYAFMAFCDDETPAVFADITYGFYKVFAQVNNLPYTVIPLDEKYRLDIEKFRNTKGTLFIANPNAPTGIALTKEEITTLLESDKDRVVVIDEAYIDFGGESVTDLTDKYDNLLVVQTFSKSRSMAGARLGFAIGSKELIRDLNTIKYSTNPYNINRLTMAMGYGCLCDEEYTKKNCRAIEENRLYTVNELEKIGFSVLPSKANFIFAKTDKISGLDLYLKLKENGVLIRHFETPRLKDFNRITIGSKEQMETLIDKIKSVLEEVK